MTLYTVLFTFLTVAISTILCQPDVLHTLGDHGDRITDLESKMATLATVVGTLQTNLQRVLNENMGLKQDIQNLKSGTLCAHVCPASSLAVSSSFYSTSPATVSTLSTPKYPNASLPSNIATRPFSVSSKMIPNLQTTNVPATHSRNVTTVSISAAASFPSLSNNMSATVALTKLSLPPSKPAPTIQPVSSKTPYTTTVRGSQSSSNYTSRNVPFTASSLGSTTPSSTVVSTSLETTSTTEATTTAQPIYKDCEDAWIKGKKNSGATQIQPGNELIHQLTTGRLHNTLYISMKDWSERPKYAEYGDFWIDSESEDYRLNVGRYSGNAGDSFNYRQSGHLRHNHMRFSTKDRDNDPHWLNCAEKLHGGWWFNRCYSSNLNGIYLKQPHGHRSLGEQFGDPTLDGTGIEWYPWQRKQYSLKFTQMMIKLGTQRTNRQ